MAFDKESDMKTNLISMMAAAALALGGQAARGEATISLVDAVGQAVATVDPAAGGTVAVRARVDAPDGPVAGFDAEIAVPGPLEVVEVGGASAALGGAEVLAATNGLRASCISLEGGEPVSATTGAAMLSFTVRVPAETPEGRYEVGLGRCGIYADGTSNTCAVAVAPLAVVVAPPEGQGGGATKITGMTMAGDYLVLTFEGDGGTGVYGTASLETPDWQEVEGAAVSGNSATVPMREDRMHVRIGAADGGSANAVGYVKRMLPAGKCQIVSIPYRNLATEDGTYVFSDTQVANDLPQGSSVLFWSEGDQAWSGGSKTGKGWEAAAANHVLGVGEAFLVKGPGRDDIDVTCAGEVPGEETLSRDLAAGKWCAVAPHYPVDGEFKDTGVGQALAPGDTVLFWDVGKQGWSGGGKNAKGWPAGLGEHEVKAGSGFLVRSEAGGQVTETRPYSLPGE
jgi:hypothetical protein